MIDIDDLEAKAKAATPGPWVHGTEYEQSIPGDFVYAANYRGAIIVCEDQAPTTASAAHIAAANPDVVLELIARLRKAEGIVRDLAEADRTIEDRSENQYCFFCFTYWDKGGHIKHDADCVFRRAVEATR